MPVLRALVQDDTEDRTYKAYTADCLGTIVRGMGNSDFPLYSDILENKIPHEVEPQEVVEHVRKLFS